MHPDWLELVRVRAAELIMAISTQLPDVLFLDIGARTMDGDMIMHVAFFFSSRRRHTRCSRDWSSDGALPIYRRVRSKNRKRDEILAMELQPRSTYLMSGASRELWQHSIPPVKELRYAIMMRTLRAKP